MIFKKKKNSKKDFPKKVMIFRDKQTDTHAS